MPQNNNNPNELDLQNAIASLDIERIKLLLNAGINLESKIYPGKQALYDATSKGNVEIVQLLLEHGAKDGDPNIKEDGTTALNAAIMSPHSRIATMIFNQCEIFNNLDITCLALQFAILFKQHDFALFILTYRQLNLELIDHKLERHLNAIIHSYNQTISADSPLPDIQNKIYLNLIAYLIAQQIRQLGEKFVIPAQKLQGLQQTDIFYLKQRLILFLNEDQLITSFFKDAQSKAVWSWNGPQRIIIDYLISIEQEKFDEICNTFKPIEALLEVSIIKNRPLPREILNMISPFDNPNIEERTVDALFSSLPLYSLYTPDDLETARRLLLSLLSHSWGVIKKLYHDLQQEYGLKAESIVNQLCNLCDERDIPTDWFEEIVNMPNRYETDLHRAIHQGDIEHVKYILNNAPNTSAEGPYGTPLELAVKQGKTEIVQLLSKAQEDEKNRYLIYTKQLTKN